MKKRTLYYLKKINNKRAKKWLKNIVFLAFILCIFGLGAATLWVANMKIPSLDAFEERRVDQSTKIYDRTGEVLLFDVFRDVKRVIVDFEDISPHIKNATLAVEDRDFYDHIGVHPRAFMRAILVNLTDRDFSQGGSTITQQVVKNSVLTPEKKISRKIKEWIFSIRLEQVMEKDEILNLYLNETPYGGSIYGVEQASISFFGKNSSDITIAEAAYLAALPQAPTYFSPYGRNKDLLDNRKNLILREMLALNFITEEEYGEALEEEVVFLPPEEGGVQAPHFVMYVMEYLENKYGRDVLEQQGLEVITTLDHKLQQTAQELAYRYATENEQKFRAENMGVSVIDPTTGEILVMVGSRNYFDDSIDGNYNITTAKRQPGSAFKPFAYAEAFNKGYTPDTILFDLRTQFSTTCSPSQFTSEGGCYSPQNYDLSFRGPMTMRDALAQSVNVPAVKALYLAGISDTANLAERMGVEGLGDLQRYGLTLVLGGGEVSLMDMVSAYGVFANEGVKNKHTPILEIRRKNGDILEEKTTSPERVLERETALLISDILSDNNARAPLFGFNSLLNFPGHYVAVKTGTTNNYRDAWIIGYTNNISVGAWAGNNDNTPMSREIAGLIIAPMWNELMTEILRQRSSSAFARPAYLSQNKAQLKPVLRGEWRVPMVIEGEIENDQNNENDEINDGIELEETNLEEINEIELNQTFAVHSILHWVNRNNPRGPAPSNPSLDSQYHLWEFPVRNWAQNQNL